LAQITPNDANITLLNTDKMTPEIKMAYIKKVVALVANTKYQDPQKLQIKFQKLVEQQPTEELKKAFTEQCNLMTRSLNAAGPEKTVETKEEMIERNRKVWQTLIDQQSTEDLKDIYRKQWEAWVKAANV
jgi:hypothetical protein